MTEIKRAVIVPRVSTSSQAEEGTSLEVQELACLRKAAELGAPVHAVYRDEGVSGARYLTREGIQRALSDVEEGRAHYLITSKLDRAGRDLDILRDIRKRVHRAGGELVFADGVQFARTAVGNLMYNQLGAFAEFERDTIRDRTMSGMKAKAEKGLQPARAMRPYGYLIVTKEMAIRQEFGPDQIGTYVVVEREARWAREIFSHYAAGASLREVCRLLVSEGVATPRGGDYWRPSTIKRILGNPVYMGKATYGRRERLTDESRLLQGFRCGYSIRETKEERWTFIPCPAIVDEETWQLCAERSGEAQSLHGGNPERRHLLSGILRCPVCKRGMNGTRRERNGRTEHHYHCPHSRASRNSGGEVCTPTHYNGFTAEKVVTHGLLRAAREPVMLETALEAWRRRDRTTDSTDDADTLRRNLTALNQRERAAVEAQIAGIQAGADPSTYASVFTEIAREKKDLTARLERLEGAQKREKDIRPKDVAAVYAEALCKLDVVLHSEKLTIAEKHKVLGAFIASIAPEDDGYRITLRPQPLSDTVANVNIFATVSTVSVEISEETARAA